MSPYPYTYRALNFYWKVINSQALQFLLKLFPLSGSLVIIYCPAQPPPPPQKKRKELQKDWEGELSEM